jgi:hypothetical protein
LTKFDLLDLSDGRAIERLIDDPIALCDVLYVLCRDQATERSVTDEKFGEGLAGDALDNATEALLTELVNFFPPRKRTILAKALATVKAVQAKMYDQAMAALDDPKVAEQVEKALTAGSSSGSAPESADSTLAV